MSATQPHHCSLLYDRPAVFAAAIKAPFRENWYDFATELPLKLRSVAHFYTTVVNTNHALRHPNEHVYMYLLTS